MTRTEWMKPLIAAMVPIFVAGSGCAFGPGEPFAELVEPKLDARWVVPAERERPDGFARLASDYEVRITSASLVIEDASLRTLQGGGGGGGGGPFNPANPPAGYTLCHGGHCHRSDGALIPYAQVEAELSSGGAVTEVPVVTFPVERAVALLDGALLPLDCEPSCELGQVSLSSALVGVRDVRFEGVVRDSRSMPRIEGEVPFTFEVDRLTLRTALELEANRDLPPHIALRLEVHPSPRIFDPVDWATDPSLTGESRDALLERLASQALSVEVSRSR